jgi:hypothetical protein
MSRPVPETLRAQFRAALVAAMKVSCRFFFVFSSVVSLQKVFADKTEEYLQPLVAKFEQEKCFAPFSGDVVQYLSAANAKLLQVDKTATPLVFTPPIVTLVAVPITAAVPDTNFWEKRGELTKKYMNSLMMAGKDLKRLPAEVNDFCCCFVFLC